MKKSTENLEEYYWSSGCNHHDDAKNNFLASSFLNWIKLIRRILLCTIIYDVRDRIHQSKKAGMLRVLEGQGVLQKQAENAVKETTDRTVEQEWEYVGDSWTRTPVDQRTSPRRLGHCCKSQGGGVSKIRLEKLREARY